MQELNLTECVTGDELAQMFEDAFAGWDGGAPDSRGRRESPRDSKGRRQAPRIPVPSAKPLFLVSYEHEDREHRLNTRAKIVDISADGLGILLTKPLPLGSTLRFAFLGDDGEHGFGIASVVRCDPQKKKFLLGLTFVEHAGALEVDQPENDTQLQPGTLAKWHGKWRGLADPCGHFFRVATSRQSACRSVQLQVDGEPASFRVEAKLFRYSATLAIAGKKIVSQSGALRNRFQSLFSDANSPTIVHLEGSNLDAWATIRPNKVTECTLELSMQQKHALYRKALQGKQENPDPPVRKKNTPRTAAKRHKKVARSRS